MHRSVKAESFHALFNARCSGQAQSAAAGFRTSKQDICSRSPSKVFILGLNLAPAASAEHPVGVSSVLPDAVQLSGGRPFRIQIVVR